MFCALQVKVAHNVRTMTHLKFEWDGDMYTWDLAKVGRCTLGYVIIFVTGYHFIHVLMRLWKELSGDKNVPLNADTSSSKNESLKCEDKNIKNSSRSIVNDNACDIDAHISSECPTSTVHNFDDNTNPKIARRENKKAR